MESGACCVLEVNVFRNLTGARFLPPQGVSARTRVEIPVVRPAGLEERPAEARDYHGIVRTEGGRGEEGPDACGGSAFGEGRPEVPLFRRAEYRGRAG